MSLFKGKIITGEFRKLNTIKSGIHKWMKNQMNRFIRRKSKQFDIDNDLNPKKEYKGLEKSTSLE